ncbi:exfoliative toxin [Streptococcus pyogenes]|nr:exfoliative toxin [Streptococcus pyogenes]VGV28696.1 exfoliative toxin [Streptococcus pyogenes]VGW15323.1 exfoliative toxin [Streptococcus pyogenes]VHC82478.1 exfoliative toxin [Streptococcus pyogenes]
MIDLKRNLFKIDVRAQKDEEKVFMRTACFLCFMSGKSHLKYGIITTTTQ